MGNTLEAIQFIGKHQLNIFVTIDYNNSQVTGNCSDIIPIEPVFEFFKNNGWNIVIQDNESITENIKFCYNINGPSVLVIKTKKGNGFKSIKRNIKKWHYKKIESEIELQLLVQELQDI
jgi:transketolase N-terminal domain/subunit